MRHQAPRDQAGEAAATSPIPWDWVDSANTRVRVKYADKTSWSTLTFADAFFRATWLASEIDASGMWNKEKDAMLGTEPCGDGPLGGGTTGSMSTYSLRASGLIGMDEWESSFKSRNARS